MNNETSTTENPIGLYYHEGSDTYVGAMHSAMADASVRMGYSLIKEGKDAAMMTDKDIEARKTGKVEPKPEPKVEESK